MVYIVGIGGARGAGKTTLCDALRDQLPFPWIVRLSMDLFRRPLETLLQPKPDEGRLWEGERFEWAAPDSIDWLALRSVLIALKLAVPSPPPLPPKNIAGTNTGGTNTGGGGLVSNVKGLWSADIVLLDGCLALYDDQVRAALDLAVFVDVDLDLLLERAETVSSSRFWEAKEPSGRSIRSSQTTDSVVSQQNDAFTPASVPATTRWGTLSTTPCGTLSTTRCAALPTTRCGALPTTRCGALPTTRCGTLSAYRRHLRDGHERFVLPTRRYADLMVSTGTRADESSPRTNARARDAIAFGGCWRGVGVLVDHLRAQLDRIHADRNHHPNRSRHTLANKGGARRDDALQQENTSKGFACVEGSISECSPSSGKAGSQNAATLEQALRAAEAADIAARRHTAATAEAVETTAAYTAATHSRALSAALHAALLLHSHLQAARSEHSAGTTRLDSIVGEEPATVTPSLDRPPSQTPVRRLVFRPAALPNEIPRTAPAPASTLATIPETKGIHPAISVHPAPPPPSLPPPALQVAPHSNPKTRPPDWTL